MAEVKQTWDEKCRYKLEKPEDIQAYLKALDIAIDAKSVTKDQLKSRYRNKTLKVHPDKTDHLCDNLKEKKDIEECKSNNKKKFTDLTTAHEQLTKCL